MLGADRAATTVMTADQVLVVDDDATNRRLVAAVLQRSGYGVTVVADGESALAHLQGSHCAAIVLDYMMPGMDGPEVLRRLRQLPEHAETPVLLLTASDSSEHIAEAFQAGAQDFLTRPVNARILRARVASAMHMRRVQREAETAAHQKRTLMAELEEARLVQQSQLPQVPLRWSGWRATGSVVPSGKIGGDLFTLTVHDGARATIGFIDVSGHGVAAALVASRFAAELQTACIGRGPAQALAFLNEKMSADGSGKYAVIALVETSQDGLRVVNAGLPPVAVVRDGRIVRQVEACGVPPGLLPDQEYQEEVFAVELGDRLVLLSDGLTEPFGDADDTAASATSMGLLGDEWEVYFQETGAAAARIADRLGSDQPDDATLLLLERWEEGRRTFAPNPSDVPTIVRWIADQLPAGWVDDLTELGLVEAVTNAVVHGALGRHSQGRAQRLADYSAAAPAGSDPLCVQVRKEASAASVVLAWSGAACPPEFRVAPAEPDPLAESGRGLHIIHSVFRNVLWQEDGLSVCLALKPNPSPNS